MAARSTTPPPRKIDTYYRLGEITIFVVFVIACAVRAVPSFQEHWPENLFLFLCAAGSQAFRIRVSAVDDKIAFGLAAAILGLALPSPDILSTVLIWVLGLTLGAAITYRDLATAARIGGRQVLVGLGYVSITTVVIGWSGSLPAGILIATAAYIAISLLLWRLPVILSDDDVMSRHFIPQRLILVFLLNACIPIVTHVAEPQAFTFILTDASRMKLIMDLTVTTAVFSVIALIMYGSDARHRLDGVIRTATALPWPDDPDPLQQMKDFAAETLKVDRLEIRSSPPRSRFEIGTPFRTHSGEERYLIALRNPGSSPLLDRDQEALSAIAHIGQETMRVRGEANELRTEANTDPLTGLFNYRGFQMAIDDVRLRRRDRGGVAVVYIDLDGFKSVNDRYGHDTGNHVLREVAHRLQEAVRPRDTVARVGGDEFVILLRDIKDQGHAQQVLHRILASASAPVALIAQELPIKLSAGVSFSDDPNESLERLVTSADSLMYANRGHRLSPDAETESRPTGGGHNSLSERAAAIVELITGKQLTVEYQPIVDAARGTVVAIEALVRGTHPAYGVIEPSLLVHEAKRLDLLDLLTEQVLDQAFADYPLIVRAVPTVEDVHVNVDLEQLSRNQNQERLQRLCAEHPDVKLTVEMTENSLNLVGEDILAKLGELRASGIKLALDDFGQGYSTILSIVDFPFDALKIDRSLIATITSSPKSNHVIRAMARLCRSLRVSMIIEGVERIDERDALLRLGARQMQGFLFSPSLTVDDFCARYAGKSIL